MSPARLQTVSTREARSVQLRVGSLESVARGRAGKQISVAFFSTPGRQKRATIPSRADPRGEVAEPFLNWLTIESLNSLVLGGDKWIPVRMNG